MIRGFYSSAAGLVTQQNNMDILANNMANAQTTGFKPQHASFADLLYQNINSKALDPVNCGSGVKVGETAIDFTQGTLQQTGIETDCAILGEGFFAVQSQAEGDESIYYTRDGSFRFNSDGSDLYLVTASGDRVLTAEGDPVTLTKNETTGEYFFDPSTIGVYTFVNKFALQPVGGNRYAATEAAGEAQAAGDDSESTAGLVKTGYLESSAVDIAREMVKVIEASKAFSLNSKMIQVADDIEKIVNQLR